MSDGSARGIVTPEAVVLAFETAGVPTRMLATLIDAVVQGAALIVLLVAFGVLAQTPFGLAGVYFGLFAVVFGYPIVMEATWRGRTLGKAAMGLRVVTIEGGQIGFRHALVRGAFDLVDLIATAGAAATLAVLATDRNQRLGDLVAGTMVLRERTGLPRPASVQFVPPPGWEGYAATLDVGGLSPDDVLAARTFLLRAHQFDRASRERLAVTIATATLPRLHHQPPPGVAAEPFLVCLVARYQERNRLAGGPLMPAASWETTRAPGGAALTTGVEPASAATIGAGQGRQPGEPARQGDATPARPGAESAPRRSPPDSGGFVAPG